MLKLKYSLRGEDGAEQYSVSLACARCWDKKKNKIQEKTKTKRPVGFRLYVAFSLSWFKVIIKISSSRTPRNIREQKDKQRISQVTSYSQNTKSDIFRLNFCLMNLQLKIKKQKTVNYQRIGHLGEFKCWVLNQGSVFDYDGEKMGSFIIHS